MGEIYDLNYIGIAHKKYSEEVPYYKYIKDVVVEKPRAVLYIDDKAFRFENWVKTNDFVSSINT